MVVFRQRCRLADRQCGRRRRPLRRITERRLAQIAALVDGDNERATQNGALEVTAIARLQSAAARSSRRPSRQKGDAKLPRQFDLRKLQDGFHNALATQLRRQSRVQVRKPKIVERSLDDRLVSARVIFTSAKTACRGLKSCDNAASCGGRAIRATTRPAKT